jgi:hypothetical protein
MPVNFRDFLIERRGMYNPNNTIVVDIQPEYEKYIRFPVAQFVDFLKTMLEKGKRVVYFFNGESIGSKDSEESIIYWLMEHLNEDEQDNFYYLLQHNIIWRDKGYGFFRGWMDDGVEDATLIKFIRHMTMQKTYDSRDISPEDSEAMAGNNKKILNNHDNIYMPDISIPMLKQFNGAYLCGGSRRECLKEVTLLLNAFNIKYTMMSKFIF